MVLSRRFTPGHVPRGARPRVVRVQGGKRRTEGGTSTPRRRISPAGHQPAALVGSPRRRAVGEARQAGDVEDRRPADRSARGDARPTWPTSARSAVSATTGGSWRGIEDLAQTGEQGIVALGRARHLDPTLMIRARIRPVGRLHLQQRDACWCRPMMASPVRVLFVDAVRRRGEPLSTRPQRRLRAGQTYRETSSRGTIALCPTTGSPAPRSSPLIARSVVTRES